MKLNNEELSFWQKAILCYARKVNQDVAIGMADRLVGKMRERVGKLEEKTPPEDKFPSLSEEQFNELLAELHPLIPGTSEDVLRMIAWSAVDFVRLYKRGSLYRDTAAHSLKRRVGTFGERGRLRKLTLEEARKIVIIVFDFPGVLEPYPH